MARRRREERPMRPRYPDEAPARPGYPSGAPTQRQQPGYGSAAVYPDSVYRADGNGYRDPAGAGSAYPRAAYPQEETSYGRTKYPNGEDSLYPDAACSAREPGQGGPGWVDAQQTGAYSGTYSDAYSDANSDTYSDAYQDPDGPQEADMAAYPAYGAFPPPGDGQWASGRVHSRPRRGAGWTVAALSAFAVLCLLMYAIYSLHSSEDVFRQKAAIVHQSVIAQGIRVDGVHVGGMTKDQAASVLAQTGGGASGGTLRISVLVDEEQWIITENELPLERNIASVLETAYAVGRQGSPEIIGTNITPFEYRYQHLYHTVTTPLDLRTAVTYDPARARELVRIIEGQVNREPQNAQVATFDFNTRSFTFTQDAEGRKIDGEQVYNRLIEALDQRDYTAEIVVKSERAAPAVTAAQLNQSFSLISTYSTDTTSDANRNNNISLACAAVTGTAVMPGETFSFNKATGQRTEEKGYLPAAAIQGGATVDEVGGGVCQVSSTLFNAAAMADMTILSRSPHAWPSNYVDKGRDATVNWPSLDFAFRNDRDTPIFIVAYYQQRKCTVEIYGASLGQGVSIDLETKLISTTQPPSEPLYEQNPLLPPGTVQEKKKARTGYLVETYRVYRQNGAESRRELLCTSNYQMIQQVIEYN